MSYHQPPFTSYRLKLSGLEIHRRLLDKKKAIEKEFGGELICEELLGRRACRVKTMLLGG